MPDTDTESSQGATATISDSSPSAEVEQPAPATDQPIEPAASAAPSQDEEAGPAPYETADYIAHVQKLMAGKGEVSDEMRPLVDDLKQISEKQVSIRQQVSQAQQFAQGKASEMTHLEGQASMLCKLLYRLENPAKEA